MFLALALAAAIHVAPGDTMSGIAASQGVSLSALEAANPQVGNPDLIFAGDTLNEPGGASSSTSTASPSAPTPQSYSPAGSSGSSSSSASPAGSLSSVPGVPSSFAACVAFHESTNGTNQAYNGGVYGIVTGSGINVNGQSVDAQKQAFSQLYAQYGTSPWAGDGCA